MEKKTALKTICWIIAASAITCMTTYCVNAAIEKLQKDVKDLGLNKGGNDYE